VARLYATQYFSRCPRVDHGPNPDGRVTASRLEASRSGSTSRPSTAHPVWSWELQGHVPGGFRRPRDHEPSTILRKIASQHARYVNEGTAAANHANVMRAVAHHIAFDTQNSVLQSHSIERSIGGKQVLNIRLIHHSPWEN
ncbi:MAG: hypothetical protein WCF22_07885, partial [Candidatus Sulfotelmatobacter sp.]